MAFVSVLFIEPNSNVCIIQLTLPFDWIEAYLDPARFLLSVIFVVPEELWFLMAI